MKKKNTIQELQDIILKKGKAEKPDPAAKKIKAVAKPQVMLNKAEPAVTSERLEIIHGEKLLFRGIVNYYVLGALPTAFDNLKVTLVVTEDTSGKRGSYKVDLYEHEEVQLTKEAISRLFFIEEELVGTDMLTLAGLLEKHRDELVITRKIELEDSGRMSHAEESTVKTILTGNDIIGKIDKLMEKAGFIHNEKARLLLFMAASSYKNTIPLHLCIKGSPELVSDLIEKVAEFIPVEDRLLLNNVSARSFYHCTNGQLQGKCMLLPNGLDKKAAQAMRLLQKGGILTTATTTKDRLGDMVSSVKQVKSHFSSISYLPDADESNPGTLTTILDGSQTQMENILQYHNAKCAGRIDEEQEKKAADMLRHIIYCLEPAEIINPHAGKVIIPAESGAMVATNAMFQALVSQICLLHQYKRRKDKQGRLTVDPHDIKTALDILLNAVALQNDELDPQARKFFTDLKTYTIKKAGDKAKEYWFTMRDLRHEMSIPKTNCFRFMNELKELEYVERNGYANTGHSYRIIYWEDMEKNSKKLMENLNVQLEGLGVPHLKYCFGTPRTNIDKGLSAGVPKVA